MARTAKRNRKSLEQYRSKLEGKVAAMLPEVLYETDKLKYVVPESKHTYTTDFKIGEKSYIEVKGYLQASERKKYILVRDQNPDIKLRFFFDKSTNKIYKGSPTTYADWCEKNGFEYTDLKMGLPKEWTDGD